MGDTQIMMLGRGSASQLAVSPNTRERHWQHALLCATASELHGLRRPSLENDGGGGAGCLHWAKQPAPMEREYWPTGRCPAFSLSAPDPTLMLLTERENFQETGNRNHFPLLETNQIGY